MFVFLHKGKEDTVSSPDRHLSDQSPQAGRQAFLTVEPQINTASCRCLRCSLGSSLCDNLSQFEFNLRLYLFSKATGVRFGGILDFPKGGDRLPMWISVIFSTFFFLLEGKDNGTPKTNNDKTQTTKDPAPKSAKQTANPNRIGIEWIAFYIIPMEAQG